MSTQKFYNFFFLQLKHSILFFFLFKKKYFILNFGIYFNIKVLLTSH